MSPSFTDNKADVSTVRVVISDTSHCEYNHGMENIAALSGKVGRNFFDATSSASGLLPAVTRWTDTSFNNFIVERPPFAVPISFFDIDDPDDEFECVINIPWTVWGFTTETISDKIRVADASVYARNSMLASPNDPLFALPLPNIYSSSEICWGDGDNPYVPKHLGTSALIMHAINVFWTDTFNNDLTEEMGPSRLPKGFGVDQSANEFWDGSFKEIVEIFEAWGQKSMDEILDMQFNLPKSGHFTFSDLAKQLTPKVTEPTANTLAMFFRKVMT